MSVNFNLIQDAWVPVRYQNHTSTKIGLARLFADCSSISDLECAPHERVSLMRLLICITQAVLGAPATYEDWAGFGDNLESEVAKYLSRPEIAAHFNLFGNGPRFLQVVTQSQSDPTPASKLTPSLATGNNPTLNDHKGADSHRMFAPDILALALLSFQCFYPPYTGGYKGKGPCVDSNMAHCLLVGKSLKDSVIWNCLDQESITNHFKQGIGKPYWEFHQDERDIESKITTSYLGRLVPRHRNLQLLVDGSGFYIDQAAWNYPTYEEAREPSSTVTLIETAKGHERKLVSIRQSYGIWRDLHLFTVLNEGTHEESRAPLTIGSHRKHLLIRPQILWVGGLVAGQTAKIHDTIESSFSIPSEMFIGNGRKRYELGVGFANEVSLRLYKAGKTYRECFKDKSSPSALLGQHYWTTLDQNFSILMEIVRDSSCLEGKDFGEGSDPWTSCVRRAAECAYDFNCPRHTPRQLKAYSAGLRVLRSTKSKSKPKKQASAAE